MGFSTSKAGTKFEKALSEHLESLHQPLFEKCRFILQTLPPEIHALWFLAEPELLSEEGFPVVLQGEVSPDVALPENFDAVPLLPGIPAPDLPHFEDTSFEEADETFAEPERIALKLMGTLMGKVWVEAGGTKMLIQASFGDSYLVKEINLKTGEWVADE